MKSNPISLLLWLVLMFSCGIKNEKSQEEKFGLSFNVQRQKLGVPLIEKNWVNLNNNDSIFDWTTRSGFVETKEPCHMYKTVIVKNGNIYSERDAFNYIFRKDSVKGMRLIVNTSYDSTRTSIEQEYVLKYYIAHSFPPTFEISISKNQADSLLNEWGIARHSRALPVQ